MTIIARMLLIVAVLAGIAYAGIWSLATFVEPEQREIVITVPQSSFTR